MSRRKMTGKPGLHQKTEPEQTVPVRVQLVFTHEGQPLGGMSYDVRAPIPTEENGMSLIGISLDAKQLVANLTAALGAPRRAGGGIIVPGAPKPLPVEILKAGSPAQHHVLD